MVVHVISRSSDSTQRSNSLKRMPIRATLKERTASSSSDQSSSSKDPSPSKRTDLIAHVHQALKEAEDVQPKPPPTRARSVRIAGKMDTYAQSYLQKEPGTNLWSCVDLLSGKAKQKPYAMIILNQPITRKGVFLRAWDASGSQDGRERSADCNLGELHYCADGGANRLFDIWNPEHRSA